MSIKDDEKEIRIGIIGAGSMGKGLLYQSHITPGLRCAAICDLTIERCTEALDQFELNYEVVSSPEELEDAVRRNVIAVCSSSIWLAGCAGLDAIIESSNAIGPAADHCLLALEQKKHLILMNSEVDLMFGPLFHHQAKKNGVVCTSCDGDQYGVLKHLVDDIKNWGLELVMAGNIKGFLDRYATPETIIAEADKRNLDYRMCTSYTDGTKLNIEMAIIANTFNLRAGQPGMAGPQAKHVNQVFECFDFPALWKDRQPMVDYILGAEPGGGVFVIGYCENPYQQKMLAYYKMGDGPFYLFYRPYHLCHIEAMDAVVKAVKHGLCFMGPDAGMRTNVYAYAKRDLPAGTVLDGIGGFDSYGQIDSIETKGLPIGLSEGVTLQRSVPKDALITMSDILHNPDRTDFQLYERTLKLSRNGGFS
jgi:predicted homoserine dehydrogenase-like protein